MRRILSGECAVFLTERATPTHSHTPIPPYSLFLWYNRAVKPQPRHYHLLWIALLLLATALRLPHPDWDAGCAAHPDERFLLGVAQETPLWGNPCAVAPDFAYGHLSVYVARLLVLVAPDADPLYAARLLSGLVGVLLVVVTGAWGKALSGERAGLLAAALLAVAPFPIQEARFYTVDPLGALCATLAVLLAMRRRWKGAGALAGLAVACKASLGWVGIPLAVAALAPDGRRWKPRLRDAAMLGGCALLAFALTSPWSLLRPVSSWRGPLIQARMVAGQFDFPYIRQYAGTTPYLYPLAQLALWGLGPVVTLAGLLGLALALCRWRRLTFPLRVAAIWTGGYFLATAGLYVKFPRYLLPIYPAWIGWAVWAVARKRRGNPPWFPHFASGFLFLSTAALGLAQAALYTQPHPWEAASRWIYRNVPPRSAIAMEHWDNALPVPLPENPVLTYHQYRLAVFDQDTPDKQLQLDYALQEIECIALASRRGYGALSRLPARYAETLTWYHTLLAERDTLVFTRCPRLGPLALSDDPLADAGLPVPMTLAERCGTPYALRLPRLDESFRVYDAPLVLLSLKRE